MPWKVRRVEGEWAVVRADTGKLIASHGKGPAGRKKAEAQRRALYANYQPVKKFNPHHDELGRFATGRGGGGGGGSGGGGEGRKGSRASSSPLGGRGDSVVTRAFELELPPPTRSGVRNREAVGYKWKSRGADEEVLVRAHRAAQRAGWKRVQGGTRDGLTRSGIHRTTLAYDSPDGRFRLRLKTLRGGRGLYYENHFEITLKPNPPGR